MLRDGGADGQRLRRRSFARSGASGVVTGQGRLYDDDGRVPNNV